MPARILALPFLILTAVFSYLAMQVDEVYSLYIIPCVILLAVFYTFSPQINWWWYQRYPPEIDSEMRRLLIRHHSFYNVLSVAEKKKFRNRMALYMIGVEFMPKGWERVPEDIKGVIAANAVHMTFKLDDFLLLPYERIVVYTAPFPSPQYPRTRHASELFEEDGVLLFSAQQVMWTFLQPDQYYNLVLHEYIKVYKSIYPDKNYPKREEADWSLLEKVSGFSEKSIKGIINLPDISTSGI